jgi:hypothetical protein
MTKHARFLLAAVSLAAAVSGPAYARDIGVATAITGNPPIRAQMDISPTTRVEATFRRTATRFETYSLRNHTLGVGAFLMREPAEAVQLYYGARAAWLNQRLSGSHTDNGWSVGPVVGFEYFIGNSVSLGAEADWTYSSLGSGDFRVRSDSTNVNVMLRYYFGRQ